MADVYVINTCSVEQCRMKEATGSPHSTPAPEALVVITGCYAQLKPEEIAAIQGLTLVLGAAEKFSIAGHLKELSSRKMTPEDLPVAM